MKFIIFIIILTISCSNNYNSLNEVEKERFKLSKFNENLESKDKLFSITPNELRNFISNSKNNYHLIIFYTYWCPSSKLFIKKNLNKVLSFNNTSFYLINPDDWIEKYNYLSFLSKSKINFNTYSIDISSNEKEYNIHDKIKFFLDDFLNQNNEYSGFPLIILIDKKINILYNQTVLCYENEICEINTKVFYDDLLKILNK